MTEKEFRDLVIDSLVTLAREHACPFRMDNLKPDALFARIVDDTRELEGVRSALRTVGANRDLLAAEWLKVSSAYPPPISPDGGPKDPREGMSLGDWIVNELRTRDAELLRLCGPICPHEGERAIEHTMAELQSCGGEQDGEPCLWHKPAHDSGSVEDHAWSWLHPEWPEGEAWLQERA